MFIYLFSENCMWFLILSYFIIIIIIIIIIKFAWSNTLVFLKVHVLLF